MISIQNVLKLPRLNQLPTVIPTSYEYGISRMAILSENFIGLHRDVIMVFIQHILIGVDLRNCQEIKHIQMHSQLWHIIHTANIE